MKSWSNLAFLNKLYIFLMYYLFYALMASVCSYIVRAFCVYVHERCWSIVYFLLMSMVVASGNIALKNELRIVSLSSIFWKSLCRIFFLECLVELTSKVIWIWSFTLVFVCLLYYNSCIICSIIFNVGRFIPRISLIDTGLFRLSIFS